MGGRPTDSLPGPETQLEFLSLRNPRDKTLVIVGGYPTSTERCPNLSRECLNNCKQNRKSKWCGLVNAPLTVKHRVLMGAICLVIQFIIKMIS